MASVRRAPFGGSGHYVVRKPFTFNERDYKAGESFDWRAQGCPERRLRQLWEARFLECPDVEPVVAEVANKAAKPAPAPAAKPRG